MSLGSGETDKIRTLVEVLAQSPRVARFDSENFVEADALANAIVDMEKTFKVLIADVFPKLLASIGSAEATDEALWEMRDNLRHIVYHIKDCKTFDGVC